jgi:hypothetical protein
MNVNLVVNTNEIIVLKNLNVVDGAVGYGEDAGGPLLGLDDGAEAVHVADVTAINVQDGTKTLKTIDQILNPLICQEKIQVYFIDAVKDAQELQKIILPRIYDFKIFKSIFVFYYCNDGLVYYCFVL